MVDKLKTEDFDGYGQEMSELVEHTNKQSADIMQLKNQIGNVAHSATRSGENIFYSQIDDLVPDWQTINNDPNWLEWLREIDPLTGRSRQQLLDEARNAFNANRVANFFNAFKSSGGASNQSSSQSEPERKAPTITKAQYNKAVKDAQTGRITEEEFNKIANQYQRQVMG